MQIIYAFTFMVAISLVAVLTMPGGGSRQSGMNDAYAVQMSAWHRAAITRCVATACVTGAIDPSSSLPTVARNQGAYSLTGYRTTYDADTRTLVTYAVPGSIGAQATQGLIAAGLQNNFSGNSSTFGTYVKSSRTVRGNYPAGLVSTAITTLPATTGFAAIPDGAPVIVSRL